MGILPHSGFNLVDHGHNNNVVYNNIIIVLSPIKFNACLVTCDLAGALQMIQLYNYDGE